MSRDATGLYSAKAVEAIPCPVCFVIRGADCLLSSVECYSEHGVHFARTELAQDLYLKSLPMFVSGYVKDDLFPVLRDEVAWVNRQAPRDECFMASEDAPQSYSYGNNNATREALHTYPAVSLHPSVRSIMEKLNAEGNEYNVCVLNYYKDKHQHLGWHADDSPEQDLQHPIAVISFGAERYLYTRRKGDKGTVPGSDRYLMTEGGLFIMPGGYQDTHFHKIPKHDSDCGGRISLTFRKLVR